MSEFLPVTISNSGIAPLSAELQQRVNANFGHMFDTFGKSYRTLTFKGNRFNINEGGVTTTLPYLEMDIVIVGVANDMHCHIYKGIYKDDADTEDRIPICTWWRNDGIPAVVPPIYHEKDEQKRNRFNTKQRLVIARYITDASGAPSIDTANLYSTNIGGMGLFRGKAEKIPGQLTFSELTVMLKKFSISPCGLPIRMTFSSNSVPVLRFSPIMNGNIPVVFGENTILQLLELAESQEVKDMLDVKIDIPEVWPSMNEASPVQMIQPLQPIQPVTVANPIQESVPFQQEVHMPWEDASAVTPPVVSTPQSEPVADSVEALFKDMGSLDTPVV